MAQASVALVNNAQREHQEFMHTVEAVARENGAVIAALPEEGVAVYPGDDPYTAIWDGLAGARRVLRFGLQPGLDVYAEEIRPGVSGTLCRVVTPAGSPNWRCRYRVRTICAMPWPRLPARWPPVRP